ncbi:hypothetical protein VL15_37560 [Burkholderia cepacia]|uniref:Uncharacterized protein n=1 Tax=Burkholderia cepacia TaxID=292 RepID=A0A0J5Z0P5_BURCE|nr:hypothetical protein [Burkholderia cepacia]KML43238.1 hypothetical protein VL15_37560 [Burkholderia cepacia]
MLILISMVEQIIEVDEVLFITGTRKLSIGTTAILSAGTGPPSESIALRTSVFDGIDRYRNHIGELGVFFSEQL